MTEGNPIKQYLVNTHQNERLCWASIVVRHPVVALAGLVVCSGAPHSVGSLVVVLGIRLPLEGTGTGLVVVHIIVLDVVQVLVITMAIGCC